MKPLTKAIVIALIQAALICSLGAKLLYDRHTRPQAWFKCARYDPNLPIRGRYLSLQIEVNDPRSREEIEKKFARQLPPRDQSRARVIPNFGGFGWECGSIAVPNGTPVAVFEPSTTPYGCDNLSFIRHQRGDEIILSLREPVLFFIPDTAPDPTHLANGDQLWVLATIPRQGPPRPIRLGIKKSGETAVTPLNLN